MSGRSATTAAGAQVTGQWYRHRHRDDVIWLGLLMLVWLIVGTVLDSRAMIATAGALGALLAAASLPGRLQRPPRLTAQLDGPGRASVGEPVTHRLRIRSDSPMHADRVSLHVTQAGLQPLTFVLVDVDLGAGLDLPITRLASHRCHGGSWEVGVSVHSGLQLTGERMTLRGNTPLIVHPPLAPAATLPAPRPNAGHHPGGQEVLGLREYQSGDPRRAISWRATARRGSLQVVERPEALPRDGVIVMAGVFRRPHDEALLAVAAATAAARLERGEPTRVLTWQQGSACVAPMRGYGALYDWFAGLDLDELPTPATVIAAVHDAGSIALAADSTVSPDWVAAVEAAWGAAGIPVLRLSPPRGGTA